MNQKRISVKIFLDQTFYLMGTDYNMGNRCPICDGVAGDHEDDCPRADDG